MFNSFGVVASKAYSFDIEFHTWFKRLKQPDQIGKLDKDFSRPIGRWINVYRNGTLMVHLTSIMYLSNKANNLFQYFPYIESTSISN